MFWREFNFPKSPLGKNSRVKKFGILDWPEFRINPYFGIIPRIIFGPGPNNARDFLRGMYVQMKANDAYIRFVFLTGISKFSKASIFSGLNNILDISLHRKFATICGYTQADIEEKFEEEFKMPIRIK